MKNYKELFTIVFKETGEILTPDSFTKYWKNYGSSGGNLYGWRPPKKIYYTVGTARRGFAHVPEQLKPQLAIAKFTQSEIIQDGEELAQTQAAAREKRDNDRKIENQKYQMERAQMELEKARKELERLKNESK